MIPDIINYALSSVWLFIPFRQKGTLYFYYFLVLSITCVFSFIDKILLIHPAYFYFTIFFFLIISLFNFKKIPHYLTFLIGVLILSVVLDFLLPIEIITVCLIIQHTVILFIILKRTIIYSYQNGKLNLFQFVLLLYEITVVTRFLVILHNIKTNLIYFYLTAAFDILIGIFFLFYNVENSPKFSMATKDSIDN